MAEADGFHFKNIIVASEKGGVRKTSLVSTLGIIAQELGADLSLFEIDRQQQLSNVSGKPTPSGDGRCWAISTSQ
ncbi:hypothetical protein, partial [Devosia pacifica]|uniref:hypothetical protein n=1 Tax=Devosia pacifica TaxID=1335967 RepID=UPI0016763E4D